MENRNIDLSGQVRSLDINCKDREEGLYASKRDIEAMTITNSNLRGDLNDQLAEKDALERHSRVLLG